MITYEGSEEDESDCLCENEFTSEFVQHAGEGSEAGVCGHVHNNEYAIEQEIEILSGDY